MPSEVDLTSLHHGWTEHIASVVICQMESIHLMNYSRRPWIMHPLRILEQVDNTQVELYILTVSQNEKSQRRKLRLQKVF